MHRIDAPDATSDHRFTSGDPTIPVPATTVTADWLNSVQEELAAAIAAAGITLDKTRNDQLKTALGILIEAGVGSVTPEGIGAVPVTRTVAAGTGLTGGGALNANRSFAVKYGTTAGTACAGNDPRLSVWNKYELCEFYMFRHPSLRPGFQPAHGGLLSNAATVYPDAWAYLQTTEGQKLCTTEAQWQAMTTATWATLADGSKVGWNGIGGAPYYAPNTATGALRLPDLRGMYAEAAGFDSLGVGGVHLDGIRPITGGLQGVHADATVYGPLGALSWGGLFTWQMGTQTVTTQGHIEFNSSRVVPTANKTQPRAWGTLACVYLGRPAS